MKLLKDFSDLQLCDFFGLPSFISTSEISVQFTFELSKLVLLAFIKQTVTLLPNQKVGANYFSEIKKPLSSWIAGSFSHHEFQHVKRKPFIEWLFPFNGSIIES